jgi:hypothetical protein
MEVFKVLGQLSTLAGIQGARGMGALSNELLRRCLEAHVVPALWRSDISVQVGCCS